MDNSNGTVLPLTDGSPLPAEAPDTADTTFTEQATATAPSTVSTVAFTTDGDAAFSTITDTAHTSTENCFRFLPSLSVQGGASEQCDCGTTTAALTTQGSITGCALSNSIVAIDQFPTETGLVITSAASAAPVPRMYPPTTSQAISQKISKEKLTN